MNTTRYIGIDPGNSGATTVLDHAGSLVDWCKNEVTEADLADFIQRHVVGHPVFAVIEKVNAMPGVGKGAERRRMGASSAFTFGRSYGFLRGLLIGLGVPFDEFQPKHWQQGLGCLSKGDKKVTKAKAQQLFPGAKVTLCNADSLLIAEFARRVHQGRDAVLGRESA
jgi:hypothetical protein